MCLDVFIKELMLNLIDGFVKAPCCFFEKAPDGNGGSNVVALCPLASALATFNARCLLFFPMKPLNIPSDGTLPQGIVSVILSHIVGHDIFRSVGGNSYPEQFQIIVHWEFVQLYRLSLVHLCFCPNQVLHLSVGGHAL